MARGQADFGMYAPTTQLATLADMAELAVRLGSIAIYDRRGREIELDDFESPFNHWYDGSAAGASIQLSGDEARSGSQCMKLSIASSLFTPARMSKGFMLLPPMRQGIEISLAQPDTDTYFSMALVRWQADTSWHAELRIDFSNLTLSVRTGEVTYEDILTLEGLIKLPHYFYTLKLVADFITHKYARLVIGETEYDLSNYALYEGAASTVAYMRAEFVLGWLAGTDALIYIDDFILTQDEP